MKCFVIMPFDPEFDDVYVAIKTSVASATSPNACRCFRLDEAQPAGRITERPLKELRAASLCVADLTGTKPNVMWEVGYAMALGCPTIVVTQATADLPFDIRDPQTIEYDRKRLGTTLSQRLRQVVVDTLSTPSHRQEAVREERELVGDLLAQIADLKNMVAQAVRSWNPPDTVAAEGSTTTQNQLMALEGAWINEESGSHMYARVIKGDLIAPYCFRGNHELTGV
jgi:hypothetical protein